MQGEYSWMKKYDPISWTIVSNLTNMDQPGQHATYEQNKQLLKHNAVTGFHKGKRFKQRNTNHII